MLCIYKKELQFLYFFEKKRNCIATIDQMRDGGAAEGLGCCSPPAKVWRPQLQVQVQVQAGATTPAFFSGA